MQSNTEFKIVFMNKTKPQIYIFNMNSENSYTRDIYFFHGNSENNKIRDIYL